MSRRTLIRVGSRGASARAFIETGGLLVRVQWRLDGQLKTESRPNTREHRAWAKQYAQGIAEALAAGEQVAPMTVRNLWERYTAADAWASLRPKSQTLDAQAWKRWEVFVGRHERAEDQGSETLSRFRSDLDGKGYAVSSVKRDIATVKKVYAWAEELDLLVNRLHRYRMRTPKEKRTKPVAEYRAEDFARLCAALPLDSSRTWRAGVVVRLCGLQGRRQQAVRRLHVDDVDLDGNLLVFAADRDKMGREHRVPMRKGSRLAIEAALYWRKAMAYDGPWLIPAQRRAQPYSAQSLWWSLTQAERRAGIPHIRGRGAHGLRRMLAGDVLAMTGNVKLAMQAIGDTDLRVMERYLVDRDDALAEAFDRMDNDPETVTQTVIVEAGE